MKKILRSEGFSTIQAHDGLEAKRILEKEQFDLVLTNWQMPNMNGYELVDWICKNLEPRPKIMMATCYQQDPYKKIIMELGADDFLDIPVDEDFTRRVRKLLEE
jgi:CheY-like chemotaxis protein